MSDSSGFSGGIGAGRGAEQNARFSSNDGQNARLIGAPSDVRGEVRTEARPLRVQGEVVRSNDNGNVRIRTPRGDIDVQIPPETRADQRPQQGQQVEVEIQPNRTPDRLPDTVVIRPAPADSAPPRRDAATPPSVETRNTQTPVDIALRPDGSATTDPRQTAIPRPVNPDAPPQTPPPARFPEAGSLVRLEPILPQQAQQILTAQQSTAPPDILTATLEPRALTTLSFQTGVIAQDAQNILQTSVNTLLTPALTSTLAPAAPTSTDSAGQTPAPAPLITQPAVQILTQTTPQTVLAPPQDSQSPLQASLASVLPASITPAAASALTTSVPAAPAPLTPAATASFFAARQAAAITPSSPSPTTPLPLDVRITGVRPPLAEIVAPQAPPQSAGQPAAAIPASPNAAPNAPAAPPALILQNQQAGQITGIVIAQTAEQTPVFTLFFPQGLSDGTAVQNFALQFPSESVAIGTQIQVTPQISASSVLQTLPSIGVPISTILAPQPWQVLQDVHQSLAQAAPTAAQAFTAATPSPASPAQFGATALFFIAAVRGGDLGAWLGDRAGDALKTAGRGNVLSRMTQEGGLLSAIASEPVSQDWRATNIPLHWQGEFHKISLHYKHDDTGQDGDAAQGGQKAMRFVFDLSLSAMGNVQLDGLFRPVSESGARLDIILRTEQHFSQAMQMEMRRIYTDAIKPSGVGGELSFQNADEGWVTITPDDESVSDLVC